MESRIKSITENYRERIQRLALFDSLYKLDNKKTKDNIGKYIDFFSLGLLSLLFFFENMLMRNKKTGIQELAKFLYDINDGEIDLNHKEFENIARTIVETFRPTAGKRNFKRFYNWESRQEEIIQYSILKAAKSDIKTNTQYYTLDEHGLELVFATKEYFSEFQLSINQLLLRKQLEKGEFIGALRQIDEMRLDVESLEDRISKIKHEVQRNILSQKTYIRYKDLIEDINIRLKRENEEFDELKSFVDQTRDTLAYEIKDEKDSKAYEYIIKIQKELGEVHRSHRNLLQKSIELKTSTLQSAQESLYYIGIESFNFKKEIVSRIFASPLPLEVSRVLISPLLHLQKQQTWSPLTVFASQRIVNKEEEEKTRSFLKVKDENQIKEEIKIQQKTFKYISEIILRAKGARQEITIEELVNHIKENDYGNILEDTIFYHFFIILHQKSPLSINMDNIEKELHFQKVFELLESKYITLKLTETLGIVYVNDRFNIKNMIISLEEKTNAI